LFRHEENEQKLLAFCRERAIKRFHTNTNILIFLVLVLKHFLNNILWDVCYFFTIMILSGGGGGGGDLNGMNQRHCARAARGNGINLYIPALPVGRREVSAAPCRMADRESHCCLSHFFFPGTGNKRTAKRARLKGSNNEFCDPSSRIDSLSRSRFKKKKKNEKRTRSEWTLKSAHQTSFARWTQRLAAAQF
jgi:hypothetical protein